MIILVWISILIFWLVWFLLYILFSFYFDILMFLLTVRKQQQRHCLPNLMAPFIWSPIMRMVQLESYGHSPQDHKSTVHITLLVLKDSCFMRVVIGHCSWRIRITKNW